MEVGQSVSRVGSPVCDGIAFSFPPVGFRRDSSEHEDFGFEVHALQGTDPAVHWCRVAFLSGLKVFLESELAALVSFADVAQRSVAWIQQPVDQVASDS